MLPMFLRGHLNSVTEIALVVRNAYIYEIACEKHLSTAHKTGNLFFFPFFFPRGIISVGIQIAAAPFLLIASLAISFGYLFVISLLFTTSLRNYGRVFSPQSSFSSIDGRPSAVVIGLCAHGEEQLVRDSAKTCCEVYLMRFTSLNFLLVKLNVLTFLLVSILSLLLLLRYYAGRSPYWFIYGCCRARDLPRFVLQILSLKDKDVLTTDLHQKWLYALSYLSKSLGVIQHGAFDSQFLSSKEFAGVFCSSNSIPWLGPRARVLSSALPGGSNIERYIDGRFLCHVDHGFLYEYATDVLLEEDHYNPVAFTLDSLTDYVATHSTLSSPMNIIIYSTALEIVSEFKLMLFLKLLPDKVQILFQPHPRLRYFPLSLSMVTFLATLRKDRGPWLGGRNVIHIVNKNSTLVKELDDMGAKYCFLQDMSK